MQFHILGKRKTIKTLRTKKSIVSSYDNRNGAHLLIAPICYKNLTDSSLLMSHVITFFEIS